MRPEGILKHIAEALIIAVVFYFVTFTWIENRRAANGPWQVTFRADAAGVPALAISEPKLNISQTVRFPTQNHAEPLANHHLRPGHARSCPFGEMLFHDPTFLPGTVTMRLFGHQVELLPRVLTIDQEGIPVAFHQRDQRAVKRIIFVTGTDTGVGKTVLTALLLAHLRGQGRDALAMKPFCSGSRAATPGCCSSLQKGCLTLDEVNPFYFDKPLAPAAAPRRAPFRDALARIRALAGAASAFDRRGGGSCWRLWERITRPGTLLPRCDVQDYCRLPQPPGDDQSRAC